MTASKTFLAETQRPQRWLLFGIFWLNVAWAGDWTQPAVVRHEETPCITYRARLSGEYLAVEATLAPGWHTFAMDNKKRADEKLRGKQSLGIERPTEITLSDGLEAVAPWYQTPPKDFSKPEIRWYTWGFDDRALFVVKVKSSGSGSAKIGIRGQSCTESTCKNIDVTIPLPLAGAITAATDIDAKSLVQVR